MVAKNWQGSEIGGMFDSITISLSKAVGGVIGSVLIGD
jgi:threonine aldolase